MSAIKSELLASASQQSYFKASPEQLEELWQVSNQFVETHRLICFEVEWYPLLEQHFYLSLLTCRDSVAKLMLKRIMEKFGIDSRRIYKLRTAYVQATQEKTDVDNHMKNLQDIEYDAKKVGMVPLKVAGDYKQFIQELSAYLDQNPQDGEAWAEIAEAYAHIGDYETAVASYEMCLVLEPLAYNVFARVGELKRLQAVNSFSSGFGLARELSASSIRYFSRSVELNPAYLRGWCGLYVASNFSVDPNADDLNTKSRNAIEKLLKNRIGSQEDLEAAQKLIGVSVSS